jgi:anaerobic selenocysteine-containing dehydrogenase
MIPTRRDWLKIAGAGGAGLFAAPLKAFNEFFRPADSVIPGAQTLVTACGICSPACGMRATVKDGTLIFSEGLPGDVHGEGHLCGKGASGAGFLYDPDWLKYPMRRTNARKGLEEDPGWVPPGRRRSIPSRQGSDLTWSNTGRNRSCLSLSRRPTSGRDS